MISEESCIVLSGIVVCPGVVTSSVVVINDEKDINSVNQGDVVVIPKSNPIYVLALTKASGLICEIGGRLSHICTIAMEMGITCITQVNDATKLIKTGQIVNIDGSTGEEGFVTVYQ